LVGVAATTSAPLLGRRSHGRELVEEAQRAERQRRQERDDRDQQRRRDLCAALNSAARAYRTAAQDLVPAARRGRPPEPVGLDAARDTYRDLYAQAQMEFPDRALQVTPRSTVAWASATGWLVNELPVAPDEAVRRARMRSRSMSTAALRASARPRTAPGGLRLRPVGAKDRKRCRG
jgi:hypothetical protein